MEARLAVVLSQDAPTIAFHLTNKSKVTLRVPLPGVNSSRLMAVAPDGRQLECFITYASGHFTIKPGESVVHAESLDWLKWLLLHCKATKTGEYRVRWKFQDVDGGAWHESESLSMVLDSLEDPWTGTYRVYERSGWGSGIMVPSVKAQTIAITKEADGYRLDYYTQRKREMLFTPFNFQMLKNATGSSVPFLVRSPGTGNRVVEFMYGSFTMPIYLVKGFPPPNWIIADKTLQELLKKLPVPPPTDEDNRRAAELPKEVGDIARAYLATTDHPMLAGQNKLAKEYQLSAARPENGHLLLALTRGRSKDVFLLYDPVSKQVVHPFVWKN